MKIQTIILAGGKSSRMGKDKALLDINGKPLLAKIYSIAQKCTQQVYVVTYYHKQYKSILPLNCKFILESSPFQGPLMAFSQGLNYVNSEWVLLLACDLAFLNVSEVQNWVNKLLNIDKNVMAFLPKNEKGWECLCGFYRRDCQDSIMQFLSSGNPSFQTWLKNENVVELIVENPQVLFNCNTPQDYAKIPKN